MSPIVKLPPSPATMPDLPPTKGLRPGGPRGDRTFNVKAAKAALNAAADDVVENGTTPELHEALSIIADHTQANPETREAAEHLRSVLDATPEQAAGMQQILDIVGDDPEKAARAVELFEQTIAAKDCDRLDGKCEQHKNDHGTVIHHGALHTASGPFGKTLLEHQLIQWSDDSKPILGFAGDLDWPDLDLPDVDALIAAVEKQLASLRECRAALAAALAPPTEPPKNQKAQPADAGEQVQA